MKGMLEILIITVVYCL